MFMEKGDVSMTGEQIISMIGIYVLSLLFLIILYLQAYGLDSKIYKSYTTNVNAKEHKTIDINLKRFFWRYSKGNNEIFLVAFITELISIALFVLLNVALIVTLITVEELIMLFSFGIIFIYQICMVIIERLIIKK